MRIIFPWNYKKSPLAFFKWTEILRLTKGEYSIKIEEQYYQIIVNSVSSKSNRPKTLHIGE